MDYQDKYKKTILSSPHCILGKKGITDDFITHVAKLLKRYKMIKIKVLRSAIAQSNIKNIADRISEATNSYIIDMRGKKIILSKIPPKN
jgi:RNA-binding protein YhbY